MPLRKKELFLEPFLQRSNDPTAIKLEGGGGFGLNDSAIKKRTFCFFSASLTDLLIYPHNSLFF